MTDESLFGEPEFRLTAREQRAADLESYAHAHPTFTVDEAMQAMGLPWRTEFQTAVRDVRVKQGEDGEGVFLVAIPQGQGELHLYQLTDDPELIQEWRLGRERDFESRLGTLIAAAEVMVTTAPPGPSKAARLERGVRKNILHHLLNVEHEVAILRGRDD